MNAADAAKLLNTDARTLRRFVRSPGLPRNVINGFTGSGARYDFSEEKVEALRPMFLSWLSKTQCEATANPGVWPYITRCVKLSGHPDKHHRDRQNRKWENV